MYIYIYIYIYIYMSVRKTFSKETLVLYLFSQHYDVIMNF